MKILISFIFFIVLSPVYAASITAKLDVNPVLVDDVFHLTYTASGSVDGEPDFSPIKIYFELLATQQSTNMSMINGNITRSKTWTLSLVAKEKGIFTIPSISFGSARAAKLNVIVKAIPTSNTTTPNQDFILEVQSSQIEGFIQEQFIITVKLLIGKSISNYQFSNLDTNDTDTLIIPLGKDQQYKTYRGSKQYIIIEKRFAVFPQNEGSLTIRPFIAAVSIPSQFSNSQFFSNFNTRTNSKRLKSKSITLKIKPIPASFNATNWLPSTSVKLIDDWPKNKKFIAGEPITRTLTLVAKGLTSAQLPIVTQQPIDGLKQYPDKADSNEKIETTGISSIQKQKTALIPARAGKYTLPAIKIKWWNTQTNKIEIAKIKKRTFTVFAATNEMVYASSNPTIPTSNENNADSSILTTKDYTNSTNTLWFWLSLLFLMLWIITLALWWKSKPKTTKQKNKNELESQSLSQCLKQLKSACERDNAQDTKKALLAWAKIIHPETQANNLTDISKHVNDSLKQKIMSLNACLYSPQTTHWECNNIYHQCKAYIKPIITDKKNGNSAVLDSFNP